MVPDAINIDFESTNFLPEEKETFLVGEQINDLLCVFLKDGINKGDFQSDIEILPTIGSPHNNEATWKMLIEFFRNFMFHWFLPVISKSSNRIT